jgi:GNAT superfamily N-acetyltransferase
MNYSIRECQAIDLSSLVVLCQKHAEYEKANFNPHGKEERLHKALFEAQPKLFCLIVEANEAIVGYASYTFDYSTWDAATFMYMDCLFLEEDARGFGIGEAIIEKLKQIASTKSCINIQWHTPTFNEGAIKFYHRIGANSKKKKRFFLDL